jgi:hypothetical protein
MTRCKGRKQPRGLTLAPSTNGRTRLFPDRYCGSTTVISPNFVCHQSFALAAYAGLQANLPFRHHDPLIGPAAHRLPAQKPRFLDQPLLGGVSLAEISVRVPNHVDDRRQSLAKLGMAVEKRQERCVTQFRRRHGWESLVRRISSHSTHKVESHPIENGSFNVLKNKGYNLEHNFGHGKQNLAAILVSLNLLAFAFHTVCDIGDELWRAARARLGPRYNFFSKLAAITRYLIFRSWDDLLLTLAFTRPLPISP